MDESKTQPTLETIVEMLKALQVQVGDIQTRVVKIEDDVAVIKAEQDRQARQLDVMARDLHKFAPELYDLRLEFREGRAAS